MITGCFHFRAPRVLGRVSCVYGSDGATSTGAKDGGTLAISCLLAGLISLNFNFLGTWVTARHEIAADVLSITLIQPTEDKSKNRLT